MKASGAAYNIKETDEDMGFPPLAGDSFEPLADVWENTPQVPFNEALPVIFPQLIG